MAQMNNEGIIKRIITYAEETEKEIKRMQDESGLENPVDLDLIKTLKSQAYEDILSVLRLKA